MLTLFVAVIGVAGFFTSDLLGSSGSPMSAIKDASIETIGHERNPETGKDEWRAHINFPDPRGPTCDNVCEDEVLRVTENGRGCVNGVCIAEMRNVDQGDLKNFSSSYIQYVLDGIMKEKQRVDLMVSGSRNFENSEYPNIIRVLQ